MPAKLQLWNTDLRQLPSDDALGPFTPIFSSNKPKGALWTSAAVRKGDGYSSEWLEWCHQNRFPTKKHNFLLCTDVDCRIHTINTRDDLLAMKHIEEPLYSLPKRKNGFINGPVLHAIDFAFYAASGLDGICVTQEAILSCREWSAEAGFPDGSDTLSFWDVESTCWFRTAHLHVVSECDSQK